jgi:hypothetical protein
MRFVLALLMLGTFSSLASAQEEDSLLLARARASVAETLGKSESEVAFESMKVARDQLGIFVCGTANGQRFVDGPSGRQNKPTLDSSLSASVFNLLWNSRCRGMSTADATSEFKRDLDEDVCTVKSWNWIRAGTRWIQLQGITSCQTGRIQIKVFEGNDFLGVGKGNIEAGAFTVYVERVPKGTSLRIEYATGK